MISCSRFTPGRNPYVITGTGRFVFMGYISIGEENGVWGWDDGVEVWEIVASGPTFQFRHAIRWREALPEDDCSVRMMDCTEEWLAVAFLDGLVTVWGWRAGEKAQELLLRLNFYHHPER